MSDAALLPLPDERSAPFFDGARAGRLMLQRCSGCETWLHPVRTRCPECSGHEIEWREARGTGVLFSHGLLRRSAHPAQEAELPIRLAVVDLDEGVRMNARLVGTDGAPHAGCRVRVEFQPLGEGLALPVFRPVAN